MNAIVKRLRKLIHRHKFRSQIELKVAQVFGRGSEKYVVLMSLIDMVTETHDNGKRRNGEFLKSHEFAMFIIALVYCKITDLSILMAILLHDMVEDYPEVWFIDLIAARYGQEVAKIVLAVTKPDRSDFASDEEYEDAIFHNVRNGGPKAIIVKCIDRLHNMLTLWGSHDKKTRKVIQTIKYVLPMSAEHQFLIVELMHATSEQMHRLKMHLNHT